MDSKRQETVDEVVNDIDDLNTTVDELQDQTVNTDERATLDKLKSALEQASNAGDELEDRED